MSLLQSRIKQHAESAVTQPKTALFCFRILNTQLINLSSTFRQQLFKMFQDQAWLEMGPEVSLWNPDDVKSPQTKEPVEQKPAKVDVPTHYGKPIQDYNSDSEDEVADVIFDDMQLFCHAIGEPQLIENFLKHKVTLGQLMDFEEQDLINCGIELVGDRKKILASTVQMHNEKWMPSSLNDLTGKALLSSPGYYIVLNDVNKHLEYIGVTFRFLKRRLQTNPEIMELGKDFVGISKVASELDDLLRTSKTTHNQICALKRQVARHINDPTLRPANHIDEEYLKKLSIKQVVASTLFGTVAIYALYKLTKYI